MRILGIDYGQKHIGVAWTEGILAEPLITLTTAGALQRIKQLIVEKEIGRLVVGDCNSDFLYKLRDLGLPVEVVDETLSSHDARLALLHTTQTKRRKNEHAVAAALILQGWLDSRAHSG